MKQLPLFGNKFKFPVDVAAERNRTRMRNKYREKKGIPLSAEIWSLHKGRPVLRRKALMTTSSC